MPQGLKIVCSIILQGSRLRRTGHTPNDTDEVKGLHTIFETGLKVFALGKHSVKEPPKMETFQVIFGGSCRFSVLLPCIFIPIFLRTSHLKCNNYFQNILRMLSNKFKCMFYFCIMKNMCHK